MNTAFNVFKVYFNADVPALVADFSTVFLAVVTAVDVPKDIANITASATPYKTSNAIVAIDEPHESELAAQLPIPQFTILILLQSL